ncbi:hydantoinase/oxoprolinase family protein [Marivita sp. S6314]|uniref:hydantoinase/oxoprolinase family protein n=1 Tax=Marivita sp. S6314 TaxID=2926406 RepID=UPI001FF13172|nr:hydantoinase/oxoprolinase family protein [Marivita sp. S6314]MCK0151463.1 hydantoinase/oxoprolinase family protein [Marivita sp. S6314]
MAIVLGVDTGGTYTDAVLLQDEETVIAKAKALTTRHDLAEGVAAAVQGVLGESGVNAKDIALASLSTTLATNALVEGQGARVALIYIGFAERDLAAQGLQEALGDDPVFLTAGGHSHGGGEAAPLDVAAVAVWAAAQDVSAFAIAAQFGTRNPAHEVAARDAVRAVTGKPVTCSHELSAKLGGPKRALTAVLNARLIGLTHRLIGRAEGALRDLGIDAPLMVVRGDGALMSSGQAQERPIETILSGPAASIVGARWLTGADHALVSDIGGTTTDIAVLEGGRPVIDPDGARVGPHRTMVEAVAMRTHGLGGDSEVHVAAEGLEAGITLGPKRVLPIALIAKDAPEIVHAALDAQLSKPVPGEFDARFVRRVAGQDEAGLPDRARAVLSRIGEAPLPLAEAITARVEGQALRLLVTRGLVQIAGPTPTDALHVLGRFVHWDRTASEKALRLLARKRGGSGDRFAESADVLAERIVDALTHATGTALLEAAFAADGLEEPAGLARHGLLHRGLRRAPGWVRMTAGLSVPVVGLGASAGVTYPAVGAWLNTEVLLHDHGDVANAIGAVTGRIRVVRDGVVTSPGEGRYRAHLETGPQDYPDPDAALAAVETALRQQAQQAAEAAGAASVHLNATREIRRAEIEAREMFVEARISVEATGRPRIAAHEDETAL